MFFRDGLRDDNHPEACVLVDDAEHDGPTGGMIWRLETAVSDRLVDLDDDFG